jgi:hypothetical protein
MPETGQVRRRPAMPEPCDLKREETIMGPCRLPSYASANGDEERWNTSV